MPSGVILLGPDLVSLTELSRELLSLSRSVIISPGPRPVRRALQGGFGEPSAALICLDGTENVADVASLISAHPATVFLFLAKASPPRASLAHAIHRSGAEILSRQEPSLVITATLIALLAQRSAAAQEA